MFPANHFLISHYIDSCRKSLHSPDQIPTAVRSHLNLNLIFRRHATCLLPLAKIKKGYNMSNHSKCIKLLLLSALSSPLLANAAPVYSMTLLGTVGGSGSAGIALNNSGQVAGRSDDSSHRSVAFRYSGGTMSDLGTLGGQYSYAAAINSAGTVTGYAEQSDGNARAFLDSGSGLVALGTLGGSNSFGGGINTAGAVAGTSYTTGNTTYHAFSYFAGVMTDLGTLGGQISAANGINDAGQVVGNAANASGGYHASIWTGGVASDLGTLGGSLSDGTAINASGAAVGNSWLLGDAIVRGFIYTSGIMVDLGTLGGSDSYAYGINSLGTVVGGSAISASSAQHGYIYAGGVMTDLNSLIDSALGYTITYASAINDRNQITGEACNATGDCQAMLLTLTAAPSDVPEPGTGAMLVLGLGLLGAARARRSHRR